MEQKNIKLNHAKMKKSVVIAEIYKKVTSAKAMIFTNYQGLTHKQIEEFKKVLKKSNAEFTVTKNTLLKRSLIEAKLQTENEKYFDQPTGAIFIYQEIIDPLKALTKLIKEVEKPQIKWGILDGNPITRDDILKLSTLPSRNVLVGKLLAQLNFPIVGLHRALNWNLQQFVLTIKAIEDKKKKQNN